MKLILLFCVLGGTPGIEDQSSAKIYIKMEAEDFSFPDNSPWEPGVGLKPKWNRGGASSWATVAAPGNKSSGKITQRRTIPLANEYTLWVRYEDWANEAEPFEVNFEDDKGNQKVVAFGEKDLSPDDGEWHWSYVWDSARVRLEKGPVRVGISLRKTAKVRRGIDALILTDDVHYRPSHRGFPPHAYAAYLLEWGKTREPLQALLDTPPAKEPPKDWRLPRIADRDFWYTGGQSFVPGFSKPIYIANYQDAEKHRKAYIEKHAKDKVPAIFGLPSTAIQLSVGSAQSLAQKGDKMREYLLKNRIPFVLVGNYGKAGARSDLYSQLQDAFGELWLGIISGEGTYGTGFQVDQKASLAGDSLKDACYQHILNEGTAKLRQFFKEDWGAELKNPWEKFIFCASVGTIPRVHLMAEAGCHALGAESAAAMPYVAQQMAFARGAARQYGRPWIWYYGSSFGDAIRSFVKEPYFLEIQGRQIDNRNDTIGPSLAHIRRVLLNAYLQGATVMHPEQGYNLFGPDGELNPMGWPYDEMLRLASRHPDRGMIYTPVALLLDKAHGWDKYQYRGMHIWEGGELERGDRMINEFFNVAYFPFPKNEGEPVTCLNVPFPNGYFGNIFDVLVTSPTRLNVVQNYRVVICLGKSRLAKAHAEPLKKYVAEGGTLVINAEQIPPGFDDQFLGSQVSDEWLESDTVICLRDSTPLRGAPYKYQVVQLKEASCLAKTSQGHPAGLLNKFGKGQVLLTTPSYLLGEDDAPIPYLPHLLIELTSGLLPIRIRGNCEYFINLHSKGYVVYLANNEGLEKFSHSPAKLDSKKTATVSLALEEVPLETGEWLGEEPRKWFLENEWLPEWTQPIKIRWSKEGKFHTARLTLRAAEIRVLFIRTR
ncbi:MAG: hypothetical protein HY717_01555 [Planctomycetes bacterium]|nr:hypothetical protein [Planctomycetota bacterium]